MADPACPRSGDVAAYALGALDPAADPEFAAHIERCERCRAELRWLAPAIETLPESVDQLEPPAGLRERLLAAVRADLAAESTPPERAGWRRRRVRIGGFAFGPATALAALLIAVAAVVGYEARDSGEPETRSVGVAATPPGSAAKLEISDGEATLRANGVPQLPPGSVYQVWVRRGSTVRASSVFRPSEDGSAAAAVPEALDGDELMVTREPGRGSRTPSSAPVFSAPL